MATSASPSEAGTRAGRLSPILGRSVTARGGTGAAPPAVAPPAGAPGAAPPAPLGAAPASSDAAPADAPPADAPPPGGTGAAAAVPVQLRPPSPLLRPQRGQHHSPTGPGRGRRVTPGASGWHRPRPPVLPAARYRYRARSPQRRRFRPRDPVRYRRGRTDRRCGPWILGPCSVRPSSLRPRSTIRAYPPGPPPVARLLHLPSNSLPILLMRHARGRARRGRPRQGLPDVRGAPPVCRRARSTVSFYKPGPGPGFLGSRRPELPPAMPLLLSGPGPARWAATPGAGWPARPPR